MPNIPTKFFAVTEDGFVEVNFSTKFIGPQSVMLEPLVANVPMIAKNIMPDIHMAISGRTLCLVKRLTKIRMATFFRPQTDVNDHVTIVPVFIAPGAEMALNWNTPNDMSLFFVSSWPTGDGTINELFPTCYLVAKGMDRRTYLLPLPNLFEDGRVCMGTVQRDWVKSNIFDTFKKALEIFDAAPWNADLMVDIRWQNSKKLFRFSPEGVQEAPESAWTTLSKMTNNTNYQFIANL